MPDNRLELSRRKILGGTTIVAIAGAGAGLGTSALFSDQEEFTNNSIQAGTTNLIVDMALIEASNPDLMDINFDVTEVREADGAVETGIQIGDIKPGDSLVVRITVTVEDNPMYVSAVLPGTDAVEDSENTPNTEPENATQAAGTNPDTGSDALPGEGDLDNQTLVTLGYDSDRNGLHDNSIEGSLTPESGFDGTTGSNSTVTDFLAELDSGFIYRGQAGADASPPGGHANSGDPTRVGGDNSETNVDREQVTHFIRFDLPVSVGNEVQGDSFSFDLRFQAEQVRNNDDPFDTSGPTATLEIPNQTANPP